MYHATENKRTANATDARAEIKSSKTKSNDHPTVMLNDRSLNGKVAYNGHGNILKLLKINENARKWDNARDKTDNTREEEPEDRKIITYKIIPRHLLKGQYTTFRPASKNSREHFAKYLNRNNL